MRRHRRELRPLAEINLTSLLDVAFTLLIAFMMVAPGIRPAGMALDLPRVGAPPPGAPPPSPAEGPVTVEVAPDGATRLAGAPVDGAAPEAGLKARRVAAEAAGAPVAATFAVEIRADRRAPYEAVAAALAAARRAGVERVGLPIEPPGEVTAQAPRATPKPGPSRPSK